MNENKIENVEKIEYLYKITPQIIIYGAGTVSKELVLYLNHYMFDLKKIKYILVSERKNNPNNIQGIPVYSKQEVEHETETVILEAVFENISYAIFSDLQNLGYKKIYMIEETAYKELCRVNQYFYNQHLKENQYESALKKWYHSITGLELDLKNPVTYNEKIQQIKLYGMTSCITKLTDKYEVRKWIKERIGGEYLVSLLGVWRNFDDIEIEKLPKQFILKCTHGCEWNEIVVDKNEWNIQSAKEKFDKWMKMNYAYKGGLQLQYRDIIPRIIAEQYLENEKGDLYDYKFWCFNGRVEFIMLLSERKTGLKMNNYDRKWNLLPFTYNYPNSEKVFKRPANLEKMIELAEKLAEGFPHVRVDLYLLNDGTIKFGEMTFTPCNGVCRWSSESINEYLGELIK